MGFCCILRCMNPPQSWQLGWSDLIETIDETILGPGSTLTLPRPVQWASAANTVRVLPSWIQPEEPSNETIVTSFWAGYRIDKGPYDLPSTAHVDTEFSAAADSLSGVVNLYQVGCALLTSLANRVVVVVTSRISPNF